MEIDQLFGVISDAKGVVARLAPLHQGLQLAEPKRALTRDPVESGLASGLAKIDIPRPSPRRTQRQPNGTSANRGPSEECSLTSKLHQRDGLGSGLLLGQEVRNWFPIMVGSGFRPVSFEQGETYI